MFYLLSKLIWLAIQPLIAIALLIGFGTLFIRMKWSPLLGRTMIGLAISAFLVGGLTNVGALMMAPLEARFERVAADTKISGIIMLGGGGSGGVSQARGTIEFNASAERYVEIFALVDLYPNVPILVTGGNGSLIQKGEGDGALAKRFVARYDLPQERFLFETESRNTYQNAILSMPVAKPSSDDTWLLVTSAFHIPRSVGVFHKQGWQVAPWPVDFKTRPDEKLALRPSNVAHNFQLLETAIHEWLGLVFYYWSGKTNALFPSPN